MYGTNGAWNKRSVGNELRVEGAGCGEGAGCVQHTPNVPVLPASPLTAPLPAGPKAVSWALLLGAHQHMVPV